MKKFVVKVTKTYEIEAKDLDHAQVKAIAGKLGLVWVEELAIDAVEKAGK